MVRDPLDTQEAQVVSIYQRGKSWYYDFQYRGERYTGCIGAVSKTVAKEILAKKRSGATVFIVNWTLFVLSLWRALGFPRRPMSSASQ